MYCPACATPNPENGRFCTACGRPLPVHAAVAPLLPYAEFLPRFLARLIDSVILMPLLLGWVALIAWFIPQLPLDGGKWEHPEKVVVPLIVFGGIWFLVSLAATWLYHALLESSERQGTVGKRVMGLVITDLQGKRISFGRASVRWLCSTLLTSQTMLIGYVMVAFTEKKQTLHDMLAETVVITKDRAASKRPETFPA